MRALKLQLILLLFISCYFSAFSQVEFEHYNSNPNRSIDVFIQNKKLLHPFAGGFKLPQFTECDLNYDGIMDLVVFDREGSKISTFINRGKKNTIDYIYAPEYQSKFPNIQHWIQLVDYNADGKNDIYCSHPSGISLYKNTGNASIGLQFELVEDIIYFEFNNFRTNIPIEPVDIPAILDIDKDGDIDILSFYNSTDTIGQSVYWYKNRSIEKYNKSDSLDYFIAKYCWGQFRESYSNCEVLLNYPAGVCAAGQREIELPSAATGNKHTGSTLLIFDPNEDGKYDLLLGDFTCQHMTLLINAASNVEPIMNQQIINYPSSRPIDIAIFPSAFYLDVNNDSLKDLIVSNNIAGGSINNKNCWLYLNNGASDFNNFDFQTNEFLVNEMLDVGDGSAPSFVDYNMDGLMDIVVSNSAYINSSSSTVTGMALLKNIGTAIYPKYELITRDWFNFSSLNIYNMSPSFGDVDGDGSIDMVCGSQNGLIHFFKNIASANAEMNLQYIPNYFANIDVGSFSNPFLYDLNADGKLEIIVGEQAANINLVSNIGTHANPNFVLQTDSLYKINLRDYNPFYFGRARLCIQQINPTETEKMIISNGDGSIYFFEKLGSDYNEKIGPVISSMELNAGLYTSANGGFYFSMFDIDNDSDADMLVGNPQGGLYMFKNTRINTNIEYELLNTDVLIFYPNPTNNKLNISAKAEELPYLIKLYSLNGQLLLEQKISTTLDDVSLITIEDGIYILQAEGTQGRSYHKIIKTTQE
jgi:hypothetical protein